jgi:16S rRNA processing protein RimM
MIVMGRVLAPYGVQGWIKLRAFTGSRDALIRQRRWWLARDGEGWREFGLVEARRHADTLLARLDGLSEREDAAAWQGAAIAVPRAALPKLAEGELYLADLIGLAVVNRQGDPLGRVAGLLETPAHAVLQIEGEGGTEELIPLVPAYVDAIEMSDGRIVVDWRSNEG